MRSLAGPLGELHERAAFFARARELRLLDVACSAELRPAALEQLPQLEFHADNSSPWIVLEDAYMRADKGWKLRGNQLAAQWAARHEAYQSANIDVGPVTASSDATLVGFIDVVGQLLSGLRPPLAGLVIILAPTVVEDSGALLEDLTTLLAEPLLSAARWIFLHDTVSTPRRLLDALGPAALTGACVLDSGAQRGDLLALMSAPTAPGKPWLAGPHGVELPAGPKPAKPPDPAVLREHGIDPALLDEGGELRRELLGSALATSEGDLAKGIGLQRAAVSRAARLGLGDAVTTCRISLSSLYVRAGDEAAALRELDACAAEAEQQQRPRAACQALLAAAMLHTTSGRGDPAIQSYARAAELGQAANEPILAIECWRLAADVAVRFGNANVAADCLRRSLVIADTAPADVVAQSSAPEAARQLANIYVNSGMHSDAVQAHQLADRFESGEAAGAGDAR